MTVLPFKPRAMGSHQSARAMGSHQSARAISTTWLTPPDILAPLGEFDLDPCAAPDLRPWPTATTHWTEADQPLIRSWTGRVWLNPPFGPKHLVLAFMRKMAGHRNGTPLLYARTETELFFETVWNVGTAVLFLKGRPHFHYPDGRRAKANSGAPVCLIAYGEYDAYVLANSGLAGCFVPL